MAKKKLNDCRSGRDFIKYAQRKEAEVMPAKGSHFKVKTKKGTCIVPHHNKDLPNGTRCAILKTFVKIGIMAFIVVMYLSYGGML